mmetsp:Transcript_37356/g.92381  ORF Transcript_37356/g.92381 Transcript_37356/m.92381 type:complete len:261 (-) Transcript_37356:872-1654(-)
MSLLLAMASRWSSVWFAHRTVNASSSSRIACSLASASLRAASSSFARALRSSLSVLPPNSKFLSSRTISSVSSPLSSLDGKSMPSMYPALAAAFACLPAAPFSTGAGRPTGGPRGCGFSSAFAFASSFASFLALRAARSSGVSSLSFLSFFFLDLSGCAMSALSSSSASALSVLMGWLLHVVMRSLPLGMTSTVALKCATQSPAFSYSTGYSCSSSCFMHSTSPRRAPRMSPMARMVNGMVGNFLVISLNTARLACILSL